MISMVAEWEFTSMTDGQVSSEREALDRWFGESSGSGIVETSRALQAISPRVVVWAAVSALRALLDDATPDPMVDRNHLDRARMVVDAIDQWLSQPSEELRSLVRRRTGHAEELWNELAGDTGQPEPILAAATNTGWCVIHPDQLFNLTPALGEAAKRMGEERVLLSVRSALASSFPWT